MKLGDEINKHGESKCETCGGDAQWMSAEKICLGCSQPTTDCDCPKVDGYDSDGQEGIGDEE